MKLSEVMKRSSFIRGASKVIFSVDLSDVGTLDDLMAINKYIQTIIKKMPKRSMLLLLDVSRLNISNEIETQLTAMSKDYSLYFESSGVVVDGANEKIINNLIKSTGFKKMNIYSSVDAAKNHLFGLA